MLCAKKLLKLANVLRSYSQNNTGTVFFLRHGVNRPRILALQARGVDSMQDKFLATPLQRNLIQLN